MNNRIRLHFDDSNLEFIQQKATNEGVNLTTAINKIIKQARLEAQKGDKNALQHTT